MDKTEIENRAKDVVRIHLGLDPEKITPAARLAEDLGADSLDSVELVMAMEEEFDISITDEQCEACQTFGDVIKLLEKITSESE